jgi:2-phosphoglycolate phosphatase
MIASRTKLVVFDLDGTLVDSGPTVVKILNAMRAEFGLQCLNYKDFKRVLSSGGREIVASAFNDHTCSKNYDYLSEFRGRYVEQSLHDEELFPGVIDLLNALKFADIQLAICSNKPRRLVDKVLIAHEIHGYFSSIISDGDGFKLKPSPEGLQYLMNYFGVRADEMIFVGDSRADQIAANIAGVSFYFHFKGYDDGVTESDIDVKFGDYLEIIRLFI